MSLVIIGGGAGGASTAARYRRLNENAEIILIEKGEYVSYANCGLPYYIGEVIKEKENLVVQTPEGLNSRFNIDVRTNSEVIQIDRINKKVVIKDLTTGAISYQAYDKLVISTGATPIKPNIDGIENDGVFTLRTIPDTYKIHEYINDKSVKRAVIVGGGYIGIELAENLLGLGIETSIVELSDQVIGPLDYDMSCNVVNYLKGTKLDLRLNTGVTRIEKDREGLNIHLSNSETLRTDLVILSIGVKPDSYLAKEAGLELNEIGAIIVNEYMQTSDIDIYAIGDAIEVINYVTGSKEYIPLAGPANKQGRIVADNINGRKVKYTGTQGSAVLKIFDITVATTGINERTAAKNNIEYEKVVLYSTSHASYYPGAEMVLIKVIFELKTGKILGAQLIGGEGTDKKCDILATAIRGKMTALDLEELELSYAPPYSSAKDTVNMLGFIIQNILDGDIKQYHWNNIEELKKEDVTFLDVRTKSEYDRGHIEKSINIPLDELRYRLDEIDKEKRIYVNCQSGLRSYIACRILIQNGYMAYNLSGGYRFYASITRK